MFGILEYETRLCLLDFLYGVLELNPLKRWTPQQALQHPFITQKPFTGPFQPDAQLPIPSKDVTKKAGKLKSLQVNLIQLRRYSSEQYTKEVRVDE